MFFPWNILLACSAATVSGPTAMVGQITDVGGEPTAGLVVESLEARGVSDSHGRFVVQYKAPEQLVHFTWQELWFQRRYLPSDAGEAVQLRLPQLEKATLRCVCSQVCTGTLQWELGPGYTARSSVTCDPGEVCSLSRVVGVSATIEAKGMGLTGGGAGEWVLSCPTQDVQEVE